jgi:peptide/nickel transport system permease protein
MGTFKKMLSRLLQMIAVLFVLATITFILMKLTPGDPVDKILHLDEANIAQSQIDETRERLGLNQSVFMQYVVWLGRVIQLDFGESYQTGEPVISELVFFTPPTLIITGWTLVVVFVVSIPLGMLAAKRYHTWVDTLIRVATSAFVSVPSFFLGILLVYFLTQKLDVLPSSGIDSPTGYILPIIAMSVGMSAYYIRLMRSNLIELYKSKEVEASRLRGMSERYILFQDMFKPAIVPIVTMLGMSIGSLIGGTVVIENLFGIPGIGQFLVDSIRARDYPVVQGTVLMIGFFVVVANKVSDLIVLFLDPKQRYTRSNSLKKRFKASKEVSHE